MGRKPGRFTSRTRSRKRAVDVLFEADQKKISRSPSDLLALLEERRTVTAAKTELPEYSVRIVEGVAASSEQIDGLLEKYANAPGFERIPAPDRAVLRVAVWEMLANRAEVPPITAIDEAVTIVRQISTDDSPGYVNGVLDAIRLELAQSEGAGEETVISAPAEPLDQDSSSVDDRDEELLDLLGEY